MNIGIYVYENSEVLDFSGPFEVFSTAARLRRPDWNVFTLGQTLSPIQARGGFNHTPKFSVASHPPIDVLVVVGGVHHDEMDKADVIAWIVDVAQSAQWVTSVCTGAFLLGKAGLLEGKKATTHWEDLPQLKQLFANTQVISDSRWVQDGHVVTSAGISAGIDMCLWLVSQIADLELAELTATQMDYDWKTGPKADLLFNDFS
ncbi:DJ-1/PfpI family protein [Vibrio nitrifigilis]|uniref:DJ-1/PfpI family protein n=1 Tax=Vibrio nitrifigilis TaxID=2789781 RepID=A0ABS0GJQ3_9VIBR|nr:DJ-1/PfpI family protein [Vibrio nitrifigilis]MBF9002530.1 DJ-1/PfpI family protein [Vibrio nitrifigilis]